MQGTNEACDESRRVTEGHGGNVRGEPKLESSTARTLSRLSSPESPRLWATIKDMKPLMPAAAEPIPFFQIRSKIIPNNTAAHAMKMPEEYQFVTGGRWCSHIRTPRAMVCNKKTHHMRA